MTPAMMMDESGRPVLVDRDTGMPISAPEGQQRTVGTNSRLVAEGNRVNQAVNPRTGQMEDLYRIPGQTDTFFADQLGDLVNNGGAELDVNDPTKKGEGGWMSQNGYMAILAAPFAAAAGAAALGGGSFGGALGGPFAGGGALGGSGLGAGAAYDEFAGPAFAAPGAWEVPAAASGAAGGAAGASGNGAAFDELAGPAFAENPSWVPATSSVTPAITPLGGAAGAATATTGASALSKLLNGTATADDYLKLLGQVAPGLIDSYGASQKAGALSDLANKYFDLGAPSRGRYEASMQPGFDPYSSIAGYKGAVDTANESLLRKLSATGGNPFGNPGGLIEAQKSVINGTAMPAINEYQRLNAGTGGLATLAASYPAAASGAAGASGGVYTGLGDALGNVLNPKQLSLTDLLKQYGGGSGVSLA